MKQLSPDVADGGGQAGADEQQSAATTDMAAVPNAVKVNSIVLPSGKTAVVGAFKGKHIREASRIADGDTGAMIFALIALTTTIDGAPIVMEDLDNMDGFDVLKLQGMFSAGF